MLISISIPTPMAAYTTISLLKPVVHANQIIQSYLCLSASSTLSSSSSNLALFLFLSFPAPNSGPSGYRQWCLDIYAPKSSSQTGGVQGPGGATAATDIFEQSWVALFPNTGMRRVVRRGRFGWRTSSRRREKERELRDGVVKNQILESTIWAANRYSPIAQAVPRAL